MRLTILLFFTFSFFTLWAQMGRRNIHPNATKGDEIYLVDLDNDNDLDILSGGSTSSSIKWYENDGNGYFPNEHIISDTAFQFMYTSFSYQGFDHGDFDNDGDEDIMATLIIERDINVGPPNVHLWFFENLGNGNFNSATVIDSAYIALSSSLTSLRIYATDVDNDSNLDVLTLVREGPWYNFNAVVVQNGNGNASFQIQSVIHPNIGQYDSPSSAAIFDFDKDGDKDITITDSHLNKGIFSIENLGTGSNGRSSFSNALLVSPPFFGFIPSSVNYLDVDDDGSEDIIFGSDLGIHWQKNVNSGSFNSTQLFSHSSQSTNIVSLDFDQDGDKDIIVSSSSPNSLEWLENLGNGNFSSIQHLTNLDRGNSRFAYGDVDNDGDIDILLNTDLNNRPTLVENFIGSKFRYKGEVFYDANQNKQKDNNENAISFIKINASPDGAIIYPNNGRFELTTDTGFHVIGYDSIPNWSLTTDSSTYSRKVDSINLEIDSLNFGFFPSSVATNLNVSLSGGFPRCNDQVNYWVNIRNEGTSNPDGRIALLLDDSVTFISSPIPTDSIVGNTFYWHFDSLDFFSEMNFKILVRMPDFNSIGDTISSQLFVDEISTNNTILNTWSDSTAQEVRCSYDPNDKRVSPAGSDSAGYIGQSQVLEYMIRFQNTGNDTAFKVVISDQLSNTLDINSFEFVSSSHSTITSIDQSGRLRFTFNNILLVDSNTNEPESHGFVKFKIRPKTGLLPNTSINNTANIFFDFNPPIVTNTVLNTIECYATAQPIISSISPTTLHVSASGTPSYQWYRNDTLIVGQTADSLLPLLSGKYTVELTDSNQCTSFSPPYIYFAVGLKEYNAIEARVFPNPFKEELTIQLQQPLDQTILVEIFDIRGQLVYADQKQIKDQLNIKRLNIKEGTYFLRIISLHTNKLLLVKKVIVQ